VKILLFIGLILSTTACSPPIIVETQTVPVFSEPQGAEVAVNGVVVGTTPLSVPLEKNKNHMITVTKAGFKPEAIPVQRKLNPEHLAINSLLRTYSITTKDLLYAPLEEARENEETGKSYQLIPQVISISLTKSAPNENENQKKVVLIEQMSHLG
jgi:hypothetical protein